MNLLGPTGETGRTGVARGAVKVLRELDFLRLWLSVSLSSLGDSAYFILLGWFVIRTTGSELALGTTLAAASVPRLFLMLLGGVAADRFSRKWILALSLLVRAAALGVFSTVVALTKDHPNLWFIEGVAVLFGAVDAFFWPASGSALPHAVGSEDLGAANGLIQTTQQISMLLGPLLAAALLRLGSFSWVFAPIAGIYLASAGAAASLRLRGEPALGQPEAGGSNGPRGSAWQEAVDGFRYTLSVRILSIIMALSVVVNFAFMGPVNVGLPVFVRTEGWSGSVYGYLEAGFSGGAILGGLAVFAMAGMRGRMRWLAFAGVAMGAASMGIGLFKDPMADFALMAVTGLCVSVVNIPVLTYIQTVVPKDRLGRVMSLLSVSSLGLVPVSYTLAAAILQKGVPPEGLFAACGLIVALAMGSAFLFPEFRRMEDHPAWRAAVGGSGEEEGLAPATCEEAR